MRNHYPAEFALQKLDVALSAMEEFAQTKKISELGTIRQEIESYLQMPIGGPLFEDIITHPFIISEYISALVTNNLNYVDLDKNRLARMKKLDDGKQFEIDNEEILWVRVRKFQPVGGYGYYYGLPFQVDDGYYGFWNDEPILLTIVSQKWLYEEQLSEIGWITRPEVRILAALSFSMPSWHGPNCYFNLSEVYNFPADFAFSGSQGFTNASLERLQMAIRIINRLGTNQSANSELIADKSPFRFRIEGLLPENAQKFYNCFDVKDNLHLRTAFCLLKSAMLWSYGVWYGSRIFDEDAVANMFFGLEGCLRLIHRRISGSKNFAIKPTLENIEKTFLEKPGYVGMIKDSYEQRIEIVHPEPRLDREWIPSIFADDFYENYGMVIDLMYYAITGETLPVIDW